MKFKDRYELQEFLGDLLASHPKFKDVEVEGSSNPSTGLSKIELEFENGDSAELSIIMISKDGVIK